MAGISRSATFVIGYIMVSRGVTFNEAYTLVLSKRPCIHPNNGFISQLQLLQSLEFNYYTSYFELRKYILDYKLRRLQILFEQGRLRILDYACTEENIHIGLYKCRDCKSEIFYSKDICERVEDKIFIVPTVWMQELTSEHGPINCTDCNTLLGKYVWHDSTTSLPKFFIYVNLVSE